ncbi:chitinase 6-like [Cryptomeria japonica]|uniref:chitinase 6-like n=1 Tax=Cryptomeria japonica TaxID=3369 RepID=UPI0027DA7241|nr:chitinase 6-like [Cryptomeria japonica]
MPLSDLERRGMLVLAIGIVVLFGRVSAQNCGCSSDLCCSQYGFCGNGNDFCGTGCQQGPCNNNPTPSTRPTPNPKGVSSIIKKDFFDAILSTADSSCAGKSFYTYAHFIQAANAFPGFGTSGSSDDAKRELAAFFAHVTHETGSFCFIEEIDGAQQNYCDETNTQYPCVAGKGYFGRGAIQLTWNFNYGLAGEDIGFDGVNEPEKVAQDPTISFKTAVWFWMKNSNAHSAITSGEGFGATIQAVNGPIECNGGNPATVNKRVTFYKRYCQKLGVDPGSNLSC